MYVFIGDLPAQPAPENRKRKPLTEEQKAKARESTKRWKAKKTPAQIAAAAESRKRYREKHPECKPLTAEGRLKKRDQRRRWREKNKEKIAGYKQKAREQAREYAHARYHQDIEESRRLQRERRKRKWDAMSEEQREAKREAVRRRRRAATLARPPRPKKIKVAPVKRPPVGEVLNKQLMGDVIYATAFKAVPKTLPSYVRDAVISDIYIAVMEDRLAIGDIAKRAPEFVTGYWREFGHMGKVSLDELRYSEGRTTRGDELTYEDLAW